MSQLARLSDDELRVMATAIANPLEPHPVVAFAATCNFIRDALATPPHPGELSELGKLQESCLAARAVCRKAGMPCATVCRAEALRWQHEGFTAQDATGITILLQFSPVLNALYLGYNQIGDAGAAAIGEALKGNRVLKKLVLNNNKIGDAGAKAIGESLVFNRALTMLTLFSNKIGDAGAAAIAEGLSVNRALKELVLIINNIGDAGATAIGKALAFNRVLNKLSLANNNDWSHVKARRHLPSSVSSTADDVATPWAEECAHL